MIQDMGNKIMTRLIFTQKGRFLLCNTFTIEPGETVETRVNNSGVYIVQTSEVKYTKKLAVK